MHQLIWQLTITITLIMSLSHHHNVNKTDQRKEKDDHHDQFMAERERDLERYSIVLQVETSVKMSKLPAIIYFLLNS
jgi:hypothetical protein